MCLAFDLKPPDIGYFLNGESWNMTPLCWAKAEQLAGATPIETVERKPWVAWYDMPGIQGTYSTPGSSQGMIYTGQLDTRTIRHPICGRERYARNKSLKETIFLIIHSFIHSQSIYNLTNMHFMKISIKFLSTNEINCQPNLL